jgi:hypothetical protein
MDDTDTGATGMLRLEDLDERFAETLFSEDSGHFRVLIDVGKTDWTRLLPVAGPARRPDLIPASDCLLCASRDAPALWRDTRLRVVSAGDADYPGFLRVIWHDHVREMIARTACGWCSRSNRSCGTCSGRTRSTWRRSATRCPTCTGT